MQLQNCTPKGSPEASLKLMRCISAGTMTRFWHYADQGYRTAAFMDDKDQTFSLLATFPFGPSTVLSPAVILPPCLTCWEKQRHRMSQRWLRQGTNSQDCYFDSVCTKPMSELTGSNLHCRFLNLLFPQSQRKFLERKT